MIHSQNAHPVRQVIKVSGISCAGCEQNIAEALSAINGVLEIRPDHQKDRVEVVYDLRKLRLQTLEDKLDQLGYPLAGGF
ncbi:MAG TPA: copper chaperone, partial [Rhizobiales bacterium]|nr:copper chaperone [Hyphomicrobiales bacterium]